MPRGRACQASAVRRGGLDEIDSDEFIISMGPQHPSTHGVFRMNLRVDGETIVAPQAGYGLHAPEPRKDRRAKYLVDEHAVHRPARLSHVASCNNFGYALAVEQLLGDDSKPPERAEYIRVIMAEFTRSRQPSSGRSASCSTTSAPSSRPALYAIEERELILDLFEWATGSRMMCNYFRFGGVAFDLPERLGRAVPGSGRTTACQARSTSWTATSRRTRSSSIAASGSASSPPSRRSPSRRPARSCGPPACQLTTSAAPRRTRSMTGSSSTSSPRRTATFTTATSSASHEIRQSLRRS